ncbi:arsenite efflux transporter metallochaperone ArsD [Halalkalibacter okhensis]|uniref:Arsenic resistance operon repressor n=1 Tax=Halalkalibacter okhensis TaxID=333138 RepID=A0A0B0II23_9BACI|nr:arsenite efflux transporter metallochaperone ArsD [Halalkalibacter okhensis]KHF40920.1 arsenic resistance operon repressor [Halalkalibacter okhensis]
MPKIRIYDPAMCCATGVCGPSVDPELTRVATAIFLLEKKNVDISRYNLGSEPQAFIDEAKIQEVLNTQGTDALPAAIVDGELKVEGRYPTNEEFAQWANISVSELTKSETKSKGIELL